MSSSPYDWRAPAADTVGGGDDAMAGLPIEMFLVRPRIEDDGGCLDDISDLVQRLQGLVLMATGGGGLVVGLPAGRKDVLAASAAVSFVGGVSFAEDAPGLAALRQKFALNAARQLAARGQPWRGDQQGRGRSRDAGSHRPAPAWRDRLVDPRTLLSATRDTASASPATTTATPTEGDRR